MTKPTEGIPKTVSTYLQFQDFDYHVLVNRSGVWLRFRFSTSVGWHLFLKTFQHFHVNNKATYTPEVSLCHKLRCNPRLPFPHTNILCEWGSQNNKVTQQLWVSVWATALRSTTSGELRTDLHEHELLAVNQKSLCRYQPGKLLLSINASSCSSSCILKLLQPSSGSLC